MIFSNFYTKLWYTPESERDSLTPTRFLLQPLPYRLYSELQQFQKYPIGFEPQDAISAILLQGVDTVDSVFPIEVKDLASSIPQSILQELMSKIMEISIPTKEDSDKLAISIDLAVNPKYSKDSWDCEVCQSKKLDLQRNCPYLDPEEYHEDTMSFQLMEETVTTCPIALKDNLILHQAFEAKTIADANILPEAGALGDQLVFFVLASRKVNSVIKYYERKQMESKKQ